MFLGRVYFSPSFNAVRPYFIGALGMAWHHHDIITARDAKYLDDPNGALHGKFVSFNPEPIPTRTHGMILGILVAFYLFF